MSGNLDVMARRAAIEACLPPEVSDVVVDLHDLEFMDCSGYRALEAARGILEIFGGTLELTGARGEPLRLLSLIAATEPVHLTAVPDDDRVSAPMLVGVMSADPSTTEVCRSDGAGAEGAPSPEADGAASS